MQSLHLFQHLGFRLTARLASLIAYGFSYAFVIFVIHPIAAKAYDDLCRDQGITFGDGFSPVDGFFLAALAAPVLLARSNAVIATNLFVSVCSMIGAVALLSSAGDTPYQCFTMGGSYEDHTSGLGGFGLWMGFVVLASIIVVAFDLLGWLILRV